MNEEGNKKENQFKRGELKEIVLGALGMSLVVGGIMISPNFPIVLGAIIKLIEDAKKIKIPKSKVKRVLKNLEAKKIISIVEKENEVFVNINEYGRKTVSKYSLKRLLEYKTQTKQWTKTWFIVIFDIPESQRISRNYLRKLLKFIGFYQYQQSVYIFPYECKKEVEFLKEIIDGKRYVKYLVATEIENEKEVKNYFNLQKPI